MAPFISLPNELLIQIVSLLDNSSDLNSLILTSHHFHTRFNAHLFLQNITQHSSSALLWASQHGRPSTILQLLTLGANISTTTPPAYPFKLRDVPLRSSLNALYLCCLHGHANVARILLEAGISNNEYARSREGMPLYYALQQGHDDVATVLLDHLVDFNKPLAWTTQRATPLHLVAFLGLPELVSVLLSRGADVNIEDENGMRATHYAVLGSGGRCTECCETSFLNTRKVVKFRGKGEGYADDVETLRLLLKAGADLEWRRRGRWGHCHSVRELGRSHPDAEMRRLCGFERGWLQWAVSWQ